MYGSSEYSSPTIVISTVPCSRVNHEKISIPCSIANTGFLCNIHVPGFVNSVGRLDFVLYFVVDREREPQPPAPQCALMCPQNMAPQKRAPPTCPDVPQRAPTSRFLGGTLGHVLGARFWGSTVWGTRVFGSGKGQGRGGFGGARFGVPQIRSPF